LTVNSIDPIGGDGAIGRITKVWWWNANRVM
jgi:hypothetical protein